MLFAAIATVLGCLSAGARFFQTHRSPTVTGLSVEFAWLLLTANGLWLGYGLRMDVLAQVAVSATWLLLCCYLLWRLNERNLGLALVAGWLAAVSAGLGLAFGLSGDAAGWAGGILVMAAQTPQMVKIWVTRDTAGIAPASWVISTVMAGCWVIYGIGADLPPVWVMNAIALVQFAVILAGIWFARYAGPRPERISAPQALEPSNS